MKLVNDKGSKIVCSYIYSVQDAATYLLKQECSVTLKIYPCYCWGHDCLTNSPQWYLPILSFICQVTRSIHADRQTCVIMSCCDRSSFVKWAGHFSIIILRCIASTIIVSTPDSTWIAWLISQLLTRVLYEIVITFCLVKATSYMYKYIPHKKPSVWKLQVHYNDYLLSGKGNCMHVEVYYKFSLFIWLIEASLYTMQHF